MKISISITSSLGRLCPISPHHNCHLSPLTGTFWVEGRVGHTVRIIRGKKKNKKVIALSKLQINVWR